MFEPLLKTLHTISRYRNAMNAEANDLWVFFPFLQNTINQIRPIKMRNSSVLSVLGGSHSYNSLKT